MDTSRIFTVLCAILLLICLCLTLTTVVIMRTVLDKSHALQQSAFEIAEVWLSQMSDTKVESENTTPAPPPSEDVEADVLYNNFVLKERNGEVGVYSEDGRLIRTFNIRVSTLPREAREALAKGVTFHSWRELLAVIEDYSS